MKDSQFERIVREMGRQLYQARMRRSASQEDVAMSIGTEIEVYRSLETGYIRTTLFTYLKAMDYLGGNFTVTFKDLS